MLQRIQKVIPLLSLRFRYPGVIYYGAPSFFKAMGFDCRPLVNGHFSQHGQDELVFSAFFKALRESKYPDLFVDIGCNHPTVHSNSHFFESAHGFKVIAVDALAEIHALWRSTRPAADFVECAVGSSEGELSFDVVEGSDIDSMFSSVTGASQKKVATAVRTRTVKVRRIADILAERGVERAAILSMDIEGYELQALQGIDFSRFSAGVFIVENNGNMGMGDNEIRDLMIRNGYKYHARIWNLDDIFVHPDLLPPTR